MIANSTARPRIAALPRIDVVAIWRVARWFVVAVWISGMTDDCPAIEAAEQHVVASSATSQVAQTPALVIVKR